MITMSNQCSNLFNHRCFSLFTPLNTPLKPYSTTLRPIFPFLNKHILIGRRSISRRSSIFPPLAVPSSSDIVLIATTEHGDGSLVFRFGDASEVVEDDVVEEIDSQDEQESGVVNILDGDLETQVIESGFDSNEERLIEVADGIRDADIDSDNSESETNNVSSDLTDYQAESREILSDISDDEVLSSQSSKMNNSVEVVESTLDETKFTAQLDGDESSDLTISLLDNSVNRDKSADSGGTLLIDSDDELDDPSVSIKPESRQVSEIELVDELDKVETEDTSESDTEMHISDTANEDVEEEMKDMNITKSTLINVELTDAANEEDNEGTIIDDEMPSSDQLGVEPSLDEESQLQSVHVKVEVTMNFSSTKPVDVKDQAMDAELQQVSTNNRGEPIVEEPFELKPTMQVSDTIGQNLDDGSLQVGNKIKDPSVSETIQVSDNEVMDVTHPYATEDEPYKVDMKDLPSPVAMHISDVESTDAAANEDMELQDMKISEGTLIDEMPTTDPLGAEPTLQVSTTKGMDVKDLAVENKLQLLSNDDMDENEIANVMPAEPFLEEDVSQPHSTPVAVLEPSKKLSDTKDQNLEDEMLQVIGNSYFEQSSHQLVAEPVQDEGVNHNMLEQLDDEILQVINEDAGDSYIKDVDQLFHQLEAQPVEDGVNHNMLEQCAETDALESSILLEQGSHDPLIEAERTEGNVSSSELAEASEVTASLLAAEAQVEREVIYLTGDFLLSGGALLEHPFKALTGGDDAYFVAGSNWLGVASGVSQWSFEGTDPGVYAQELMRTCEEIVLDSSSVIVINPVELLCKGVKETNISGSSNVLIANFNGQALHVANIGDTGFLVIRHGAIHYKSSPLLHDFHFALQVEDSDDPLQLVEEYRIELEEGDIVVSATDGLFDNLYEREIAMIVSKSLQTGMKPQEIANMLASRAQEVGKSSFVRSPFSDAAQAAGYTGYAGGKPDNVAVIVSLVQKRSNLLLE